MRIEERERREERKEREKLKSVITEYMSLYNECAGLIFILDLTRLTNLEWLQQW